MTRRFLQPGVAMRGVDYLCCRQTERLGIGQLQLWHGFCTAQTRLYPRRDQNKNRGVSALRSTGLRRRQSLSVLKEDLPRPAPNVVSDEKEELQGDHGLWQFFHSREKPFATPVEDAAHGRAWTVEELRRKSWEDLHNLWWVCVKERNRISTEAHERQRLKAGYGDYESENRESEVKRTQRAIKFVLSERWYAWKSAQKVSDSDPEIDLSGGANGIYLPK